MFFALVANQVFLEKVETVSCKSQTSWKKYFPNFDRAFFSRRQFDVFYIKLRKTATYDYKKYHFDTQVCLYVSLNHLQIYFMEFLSKKHEIHAWYRRSKWRREKNALSKFWKYFFSMYDASFEPNIVKKIFLFGNCTRNQDFNGW